MYFADAKAAVFYRKARSTMHRRTFLSTSIVALAAVVLPSHWSSAAEGAGKIGKMDPSEFQALNKAAGAKVAEIKPSSSALSDADHKLMTEVALGGMAQLEMSKLAVKMAASADVRAYAAGEVEEQTGLAAKLKEIAAAKSVTLPVSLDDKHQKIVAKLQEKSGADFDRLYLKESGVDGHEMLKKTMEKVQSKAADDTLKTVASTALPLIEAHLQVARDEVKDMA